MCPDGPEMATIIGPNVAQTGDIVTLSCDALSYPPSNYTWFFNGSTVANMSDFVTPPLTMDMSGIYTCMAYNNMTGKDSLAYTRLTVHGECSPLEDVLNQGVTISTPVQWDLYSNFYLAIVFAFIDPSVLPTTGLPITRTKVFFCLLVRKDCDSSKVQAEQIS